MVDERGAVVGAVGARQPKVTTVPYRVRLSTAEQSAGGRGAVTLSQGALGPLVRGLLVGSEGELGRVDTSAVPPTLMRPCLGDAPILSLRHFWAPGRPDFHQPSP